MELKHHITAGSMFTTMAGSTNLLNKSQSDFLSPTVGKKTYSDKNDHFACFLLLFVCFNVCLFS